MTKLERVLRGFAARPWAIDEPKLDEIIGFFEYRIMHGKRSRAEIRAATRQKPKALRADSVAVIPLFGLLSQRLDPMVAEYSGGTSTERFAATIRRMADDSAVSAIVIDADSPGGSVDAGLIEANEAVVYAASRKTVIAVSNSMMCSAAYWVCSGASEIVGAPLSRVGAIGVFTVHTEYSEAEKKVGIKSTVIRAGRFKAEDNPYEPLSKEARGHLQDMADTAFAQFVGAVSKNREVKANEVRDGFGEGLALLAEQAVDTGLIDRIATLNEVLADLGSGDTTARRALAASASRPALVGLIDPNNPAFQAALAHAVITAINPIPTITTTAGTIAPAAESTAAAEEPEEIENCPECGTPLEDGECPECGYKQSGESEGAPATAEASAPAQPTPAPEARSEPMPPENNGTVATAQPGADPVKAERKRVAELNGLRGTVGVSDKQISAWIEDGTTFEGASAEIVRGQSKAAGALPQVASGRPRATDIHNRAEDDPRRGFSTPREFLLSAIENNGLRNRADVSDERLRALAVVDKDDSTKGELSFILPAAFTPRGLSAAAGSDEQGGYADRFGGFLVPTQVMPGLLTVPFDGDPTVGRTQPLPMAAPIVKLNARVDKDHSTSVSGGFTVTRKPETASKDASRTEFEQVEMKATGLWGLAFASEEILADSPISFAAIIATGFADQFPAALLNEKIRGGGGNEFLGMLNSPALVSIAKETNQAADSIVANNVIKMAAQSWGYGQAIWLANHDTRPQLAVLAISIGTAGVLLYQPSQRDGFPDMLWGRPVFYTEYCSTLGDKGDLILANMSQYLEGTYQPLQSAESVHVRFINHERTFKFWVRNAGAPWWRAALTPAKSTKKLSPFITLDERA